jgi:hypothetical protein
MVVTATTPAETATSNNLRITRNLRITNPSHSPKITLKIQIIARLRYHEDGLFSNMAGVAADLDAPIAR